MKTTNVLFLACLFCAAAVLKCANATTSTPTAATTGTMAIGTNPNKPASMSTHMPQSTVPPSMTTDSNSTDASSMSTGSAATVTMPTSHKSPSGSTGNMHTTMTPHTTTANSGGNTLGWSVCSMLPLAVSVLLNRS